MSRLKRFIQEKHGNHVFHKAIERFLRDPQSATTPDSPLIPDLIRGWRNEHWSALDEYLVECLKHALAAKGPILECGSGLTTILTGVVAQQSGNTVWSLEHNPDWGNRVGKYLREFAIESVSLCVAPLKTFGDYSWYDPPLDSMPDDFSMVICDGPPGDIPGGRFGLLPVMKDRLSSGCVILLDDAARESEQTVAARWTNEFDLSSELHGSQKPFIQLRIGSR